jgi:hypothetical protein
LILAKRNPAEAGLEYALNGKTIDVQRVKDKFKRVA